MRHTNDRLFVFSGRMFAGKDFVAKSAGLTIKGFADPIYQICEFFNGTANKSVPGVRKFLQQIGQWGWGCVSDAYPYTMERATVTRMIREFGADMTRDFRWVNWAEYGRRTGFWVNIALTSLGLNGTPRQLMFGDLMGSRKAHNLAVTNARFPHELEPCRKAGFVHFHVRCSEETRRLRMMLAGYEYRPSDDEDASEAMAKLLDADMPEAQVIWNDTEEPPAGKLYLSVNEFVDQIRGQERLSSPLHLQLTTQISKAAVIHA